MRQRSKLNVKKFGLVLACLGVVGCAGCVLDEVKELGEACPNLEYIKTEYGNLKCYKDGDVWTSAGCMIESSTEDHDQNWLEKLVEDNHYLGSFEYEICPDTFKCQAGGCVPPEETGKVQCVIGDETVLIDPNSNKEHCGAKGKCNSQDSSSEDYIGTTCQGGTNCIDGECKACSKDEDCTALDGWHRASCTAGACIAEECYSITHYLKGNVCETNNNANCGELGKACQPGESCIDGQCVGCASEDDCFARVAGWTSGTCEAGLCKATSCDTTSYYLNGSICTPNDNANCGELGRACKPGESCVAGSCVGCTSEADCSARVAGWTSGTCTGGVC